MISCFLLVRKISYTHGKWMFRKWTKFTGQKYRKQIIELNDKL